MIYLSEESKVLYVRSMRARVFEYLEGKPNANIYELYDKFKGYNHETLQVYKNQFKKENVRAVKAAMLIVFDYLNDSAKCNMIRRFNKTERQAFDFLGEWCSWEEHRKKMLIQAAERLRKT